MRLPRDKELLYLLISGTAVLTGLLWMFSGKEIISVLVPDDRQHIFYYFFSGVVFSTAFIGIYGFIRTVLCFTEFMIEPENLNTLVYENLLNDEQEGVFLKNRHGVYKIITPIARQVLKLQHKPVIGQTDNQLHKASTATRILHEDQRVLDYGETIIWESTRIEGDSEETYQCKKIPCRDRKGKIIGIIGICKNITTLKTFQSLNQQLEERYHNLFNKLPYPVLVLDSISMQPFTFNDAMNNLLGYSREEFARMRMSLHIEPSDLKAFQESISEILTARGGEFETRLVTKQRDTVNVTGYAQEIIINDNTYLHMLLYDNTETKKSTDILISSELKYRSLFEHANDAIIVVSPNTLNIIDANEIAISFLGYSRDDVLLMTIHDLDVSSDHSVTRSKLTDLEIYNHALYEHVIKTRSGERIDVEINAHKLNYGNEDVYQFVIRNISARKKTEAALISSESRYRQMFESNMAIKLVIDPENFRIEDANPAAAEFYGYSIDQLKGMDLGQINILSRDKLNTLIQQTREQNLGFYSCPHRLSNGEIRFVEVRDGPMEIEGRQLFYSIIYDVTASKEAENQVLMASKMFDYSTDAVMLINDDNRVVSVNYAFSQITGYQQSEIQNAEPEIILAGRNDCLLNEEVLQSIKQNGQWTGEVWHRLKNGESRPLDTSINCIRNENTDSTSYVVMLSPRYNQTLDQENNFHYIELTGLPNKSLFIDRLQNAVDRAQRNKNRLGIILIDFRNFSSINSEYGYDVGDQLLKAISRRLKYNTRDSDTISHFASDDFAILVEDLFDIQQIGIVAQKLISTLSEDYLTDNIAINLDVSMGISIYPEDGDDAEQLLLQGEHALRKAQKISGNHFQLTTDALNSSANTWLQTESNLHKALRQNEFIIQFLPQINCATGQPESQEALLRWQHPEQGLLLPSQFLPGAVQTGFIGAIGLTVIDQSLHSYHQWLDQGLELSHISINVSHAQLEADLADVLLDKCHKYAIKPCQLVLEFSQQNFIKLNEEQQSILSTLTSHDFHICIDDFGVNNSSLDCLLNCSVHAIKIDPALWQPAQHSEHGKRLLHGLVALSQSQNIQLIAEGVETQEQHDFLLSLDIHHMQGYFFAAPLNANQVADFVQNF